MRTSRVRRVLRVGEGAVFSFYFAIFDAQVMKYFLSVSESLCQFSYGFFILSSFHLTTRGVGDLGEPVGCKCDNHQSINAFRFFEQTKYRGHPFWCIFNIKHIFFFVCHLTTGGIGNCFGGPIGVREVIKIKAR